MRDCRDFELFSSSEGSCTYFTPIIRVPPVIEKLRSRGVGGEIVDHAETDRRHVAGSIEASPLDTNVAKSRMDMGIGNEHLHSYCMPDLNTPWEFGTN